jgi:NADP-dependent 3-hydroxy acid dehydrogenase YdfG
MAKTQVAVDGKVVAITGAARGIGRATALALTRRGARVAIGDIDAELAQRTAGELGGGSAAFPLDVTDRASMSGFADAVEERLGPIDVMINNAGIMPTVRFLDESEASIARQFSINVGGVINGMQVVLPRMLARGNGHVINIASTAGKITVPGIATYTATKHAVVGLTGSVRAELKDTPVDLSVVMPVIVRTELTDGVPETRGVKTLQPEDVADAIVEAIETRRYEVWCPRSTAGIYRFGMLLPLRASDAIGKITKSDHALLESIDSPERQAYNQRIESLPTPAETGSDTPDRELADVADRQ